MLQLKSHQCLRIGACSKALSDANPHSRLAATPAITGLTGSAKAALRFFPDAGARRNNSAQRTPCGKGSRVLKENLNYRG